MTSVSAIQLKELDLSNFQKVTFHYNKIHAIGGALKTPMPLVSKRVGSGTTFVRLSTNDNWLMLMTTGTKRASDVFGEQSLLKVLRKCV